jgi:hypothetical protein
MPNWKAIADQIAQGMYGDDWRKARSEEQDMKLNEEKMGLARNADQRASSADAREQERFGNEKSSWDLKRQQFQAELEASGLSNKDKKNQLAAFDAAGGAEGAGKRTTEGHQMKLNEDKRQGAELGLRKTQSEREGQLLPGRLKAQELGNQYEEATLPSRIDEKNDPLVKDSQLLGSIAQALNSAIRAGDKEQAAELYKDYITMRSELQKKKAISAARRESVERVKGPAKGSPYDVFK